MCFNPSYWLTRIGRQGQAPEEEKYRRGEKKGEVDSDEEGSVEQEEKGGEEKEQEDEEEGRTGGGKRERR